jgi:hypothetical protein
MMLFLPIRKIVSLTSPLGFLFESTLHLSFPYLLSGFKGLILPIDLNALSLPTAQR